MNAKHGVITGTTKTTTSFISNCLPSKGFIVFFGICEKKNQYFKYVLLMPLAETINELVSFILKGVDLIDHTSIFFLRTINQCVTPIMWILS